MEFFPIDRTEWAAERLTRSNLDREAALSQLAVGVLRAVTGAATPAALARAIGCEKRTIRRHWADAPAFEPAVMTGGTSWTKIHTTAVAAAVAALRATGGHWIPRLGELTALAVECHSDTLTPGPLARTRKIDAARTLARFEALALTTDTGTILTAPADHPPLVAVNRARVEARVEARELVTAGAPSTETVAMATDAAPLFDGPVEKVWGAYVGARTEWAGSHAKDPAGAQAVVDRLKLGPAQRRIIERAIRWTDEDTVADAVVGWLASPWHRGENPDGTVWHSLSWLLKTPERVTEMADRTVAAAPRRAGSAIGNFNPDDDGPGELPALSPSGGRFDPANDGPVTL